MNRNNTIPREDIKKLTAHKVCSPEILFGYLNRLVLITGIVFVIRPTAMVALALDQFSYNMIDGMKAVLPTKKVGSKTGASKRNADQRAAIKNNLV